MGMGRVRIKMPEMAVKPPMSLPRYVLGIGEKEKMTDSVARLFLQLHALG